jgi:hypothetical protein
MVVYSKNEKNENADVAHMKDQHMSTLRLKVMALKNSFMYNPAGMQDGQFNRLIDFLSKAPLEKKEYSEKQEENKSPKGLLQMALLKSNGENVDASWVVFGNQSAFDTKRNAASGNRDWVNAWNYERMSALERATEELTMHNINEAVRALLPNIADELWVQKGFGMAFSMVTHALIEAVKDAAYNNTASTHSNWQGVDSDTAQRIAAEALECATETLLRAPENNTEDGCETEFGSIMRNQVVGRFRWDSVKYDPYWSTAVDVAVDEMSKDFYTPRYEAVEIIRKLGREEKLIIAESAAHDAVLATLLSEVEKEKLPMSVVFDSEGKETKITRDLVYVAKLVTTYFMISDLAAYLDNTLSCGGSARQREEFMNIIHEMILRYGTSPQQREEIMKIMMCLQNNDQTQLREELERSILEYDGTQQQREEIWEIMKEIFSEYGRSAQFEELIETTSALASKYENSQRCEDTINKSCRIAEENQEVIYDLCEIAQNGLDAMEKGFGVFGIIDQKPANESAAKEHPEKYGRHMYVYYVKTKESARERVGLIPALRTEKDTTQKT